MSVLQPALVECVGSSSGSFVKYVYNRVLPPPIWTIADYPKAPGADSHVRQRRQINDHDLGAPPSYVIWAREAENNGRVRTGPISVMFSHYYQIEKGNSVPSESLDRIQLDLEQLLVEQYAISNHEMRIVFITFLSSL